MTPRTSDACPRCGERMVPVLDRETSYPTSAPQPADPPVRLVCPRCGDLDLR